MTVGKLEKYKIKNVYISIIKVIYKKRFKRIHKN